MNELINPGVVRSWSGSSPLPRRAAISRASRHGRAPRRAEPEGTHRPPEPRPVGRPAGDYAGTAAVFRRALDDPEFTGWMIWPVTETAAALALTAGNGRLRGLPGAPRRADAAAHRGIRDPAAPSGRSGPGAGCDPRLDVPPGLERRGSPARAPGPICRGRSASPKSLTAPPPPCRSSMPCTGTRSKMSGARWPTT